jgi:hypothetical protein
LHTLRTFAVGFLVIAAAAALSGCTVGAVVAADGSPLTGYDPSSTVTFRDTTSFQEYTIALVESAGALTFSFDPYVAASGTNGGFIPPGHYRLDVNLCTDPTHCMPYGNFTGFDLSYDQTCTDTYTHNSVPCAVFKVVRCQFPADYRTYGSLCTNATVSGGITTVGVLDGP